MYETPRVQLKVSWRAEQDETGQFYIGQVFVGPTEIFTVVVSRDKPGNNWGADALATGYASMASVEGCATARRAAMRVLDQLDKVLSATREHLSDLALATHTWE